MSQSTDQLRCQQIMRRPVETVLENDSVVCAARKMRERDVGFLPVCNHQGVVVGVLTDRDVAIRVAAEDHRPSGLCAREAMTRAVVSCNLDDTIANVERLMREHRITRVVIVDSLGRAAGVISLSDLSQYEGCAKIGRTFRAVAERKYSPERP